MSDVFDYATVILDLLDRLVIIERLPPIAPQALFVTAFIFLKAQLRPMS